MIVATWVSVRDFSWFSDVFRMNSSSLGYLWLDWFSLPLSSQSPHLLHQHHLAAESMAAHVQSSDLFVALVPPLEHRETGKRLR